VLALADPRSHEQMVVLPYLDARRRYCLLIIKAVLQHDSDLEPQAQAGKQCAEVLFEQPRAARHTARRPGNWPGKI